MSSKIRTCFKSRFTSGLIVEADFSQLEVVVQAALTDSRNMIADLLSGKDMHTERAAAIFGIPEAKVTPQQRRIAKALSFQLAFGARPKGMAKKLGIALELAESFVTYFYGRYPEVKAYNDRNQQLIQTNAVLSGRVRADGSGIRTGTLRSVTGKLYFFDEQPSPYGKAPSISPTQVANYPIQGTAADIVALFRAKMYRALQKLDNLNIVPICTVHDSLVYDVASEQDMHQLIAVLDVLMDAFSDEIALTFPELSMPVPLKMDVKAGPDWHDQKKVISLPTK